MNLAAHQYLNKQNQKLEVQYISTQLKRIDPWKPECRVCHLNEWHRWHFVCQGRYNWSSEIYSFEYQSIFADKMTHPINWSAGPTLEQHRCSVGQCTSNMGHSLANTSRWTNVVSMLVQRLRRWPNIKATSVQRLALANPRDSHLSKWRHLHILRPPVINFRRLSSRRVLCFFTSSTESGHSCRLIVSTKAHPSKYISNSGSNILPKAPSVDLSCRYSL